jgi:hypothetical protein
MAKAEKAKKQFHGERPCRVVRKIEDDVVVEYTDEAGGLCRLSEEMLTSKPSD